jgi:hypothetical protein
MKTLPIPSLALGVCLLTLSAGVAFADNLHNQPGVSPKGPTGTGSSGMVTASCGGGMNTIGGGAKTNSGVSSPFNLTSPTGGGNKVYAGAGAGNSNNSSGFSNSQYDNACAQQAVQPH